MKHRVSTEIGGLEFTIEMGKVAKQADGAAYVSYGDTVVLVTACASKEPREGMDFFPLTVDYRENTYAAGKIPGGFFKREGRPTEKEILTSRLIDRPLRPLFPEGFSNETQVIAMVLSADKENDPDVMSITGRFGGRLLFSDPFIQSDRRRAGRTYGRPVCRQSADQQAQGQQPEPDRGRNRRCNRDGGGRRQRNLRKT